MHSRGLATVPPVPDTVALLQEQAPHLADRPLTEIPADQDNAVVRVGDDLVARLPRHDDAVPLIANEIRWVPGATADVAPYDPDAMAEDLVPLLRALHRPAPPDAPRNPWRDVPLCEREATHLQVLTELRHPRTEALVAELHDLAQVPGPAGPKVWVHGDLHPRNLVVRDCRLAGLIDRGDLHAGDRAVDLAGVWMLLPEHLHEPVRAGLGVDDDTWARARGWALVLAAVFARIGRRDGDAWFAALADTVLDRACPP